MLISQRQRTNQIAKITECVYTKILLFAYSRRSTQYIKPLLLALILHSASLIGVGKEMSLSVSFSDDRLAGLKRNQGLFLQNLFSFFDVTFASHCRFVLKNIFFSFRQRHQSVFQTYFTGPSKLHHVVLWIHLNKLLQLLAHSVYENDFANFIVIFSDVLSVSVSCHMPVKFPEKDLLNKLFSTLGIICNSF